MKHIKHLPFFTLSIASLLGLSCLIGIGVNQDSYQKADAYTSTSSPTRNIDLNDKSPALIRSYYQEVDGKANDNILISLKNILKRDQKYFSYPGNATTQVWQAYEISDRDWEASPASEISGYDPDTNKINGYQYHSNKDGANSPFLHILYYNRLGPSKVPAFLNHEQDNQYGFNQEHIWAKSWGFDSDVTDEKIGKGGARGDLHHLWPGNGFVNGTMHNNYYYGYVDKSQDYVNAQTYVNSKGTIDNTLRYTEMKIDGNLRGMSKTLPDLTKKVGKEKQRYVFEPQDSDKGDIARALFYMAARYNHIGGVDEDGVSGNNPDLRLGSTVEQLKPQVTGTSSAGNPYYMGIMQDLLEWNRLDPPDNWEIHRNNLVDVNFTHNRNPFIDFPEWAEYIWGNKIGQVVRPQTDKLYTQSGTEGGGTTPSHVSVSSVNVSPKEVTLNINDTTQLTTTINPSNATNKNVTYSSSNETVAKVSNSGLITAKGAGFATITVKSSDGNKSDTCKVTVNKDTSSGGEITPTPTPGKTFTVTTKIADLGWVDDTAYETFKAGPITYNGNGRYYANGNNWRFYQTGNGKLNIACDEGYELVSTKITFTSSNSGVLVYDGVNYTSPCEVNLSGKLSKDFTVISSDANKSNGQVRISEIATTYKKLGTSNIPVTSVVINEGDQTLNINDEVQLTHSVLPSDATNKNVTYSSSNAGVASVTTNGLVKGISEGTAIITVTSQDGSHSDSVNVTVNKSEGEISPDPVDPPSSDFKTTTMKADTPSKGAANFESGNYYIGASKVDGTEAYFDPLKLKTSKTKPSESAWSDNLSYVTFTNVGNNQFELSYLRDGVKKYINYDSSTDIKEVSSNPHQWTLSFGQDKVNKYKDATLDENLILLSYVSSSENRSLLYRGDSNIFGAYATSNALAKDYTGLYLYKQVYVYDVLVDKLKTMNCESMKDHLFNQEIQALYNKLSVDEKSALASESIVCSDKSTYNALQAYEYALSYYGVSNPSHVINKSITITMMAITLVVATSTISISVFVIYHRKRKIR